MSVTYFTKDGTSYTPVSKDNYSNNLSSGVFKLWEGTGKIVLTDFFISLTNDGTFAVKYGRDAASSIIFQGYCKGSSSVSMSFQTPFVGDRGKTAPGNIYIEGGPGVGPAYAYVAGFEIF